MLNLVCQWPCRGLVSEAGGYVFGRDKRLALREMWGMPHTFNQVKYEQELEMEMEQEQELEMEHEQEQVQHSVRER